jgi:hypothetical protein
LNGIAFFHPEFLWGLAACAIPVIVHLLNRRRLRRLDFSTLRFFPRAAVRTSRMRTLKRLLLLLARTALLAALALIFSGPYSTRDPFAVLRSPEASVFAFVDPTVSMDYRENGVPRWRAAFSLLDTLDKALPSGARRFLYGGEGGGFVPVRAFETPRSSFTRHGPAPLREMFSALSREAHRAPGRPLLVFVSDFQENAGGGLDSQLARCGMPVICASVAPASPWNRGIRDVSASSANRSSVTARVSCTGKEMRDAGVTVAAGGLRVGHGVANAAPGRDAIVAIAVTADRTNPGLVASLDAADPFPDDDAFYFVQGANEAPRVLITGDPAECFPVKAAFAALGPKQWDAVVRPGMLVSWDDVDSAALVVLCGVRRFSPPIAALARGSSPVKKAVIFSPTIDSANPAANEALLPGGAGARLRPVFDGRTHGIVFPDTVSPLFSGFRLLRDADARVQSYCAGLPGTVLARLDNGAPFATHLVDSAGNSWVLLSAAIGLSDSGAAGQAGLFVSGAYVPLLDRLSRFALSAIQKEPQTWTAGVSKRNPYFGGRRGADVFDESGRSVSRWSSQPMVVFDRPGLYRVAPDGEGPFRIAANVDSAEADFAFRPPSPGPEAAPRVAFVGKGGFPSFIHKRRAGSFSGWLWTALGIFFLTEVLLWERKRQEKTA